MSSFRPIDVVDEASIDVVTCRNHADAIMRGALRYRDFSLATPESSMDPYRFIRATLPALAIVSSATSSFAAGPAPADDRRAQVMALMESCKADAQRLCADTEPGRGKKLACLDSHKPDVSSACRDALPKLDAMRDAAAKRAATAK